MIEFVTLFVTFIGRLRATLCASGCVLSAIEVYWFFHTFDSAGQLPADWLYSNSEAVIDTASDRESK